VNLPASRNGNAPRRTVKAARVRVMSQADRVASVREAAAVCNVTPPVVRRWLSLGLISEPAMDTAAAASGPRRDRS
jgi:hypothetical protein